MLISCTHTHTPQTHTHTHTTHTHTHTHPHTHTPTHTHSVSKKFDRSPQNQAQAKISPKERRFIYGIPYRTSAIKLGLGGKGKKKKRTQGS